MNKFNYIALCDSDICATKRIKVGTVKKKGQTYDRIEPRYIGAQRKDVSKCTTDCKSALFWIREDLLAEKRQKVG